MLRKINFLALLILLAPLAFAQTKINPSTGIDWPDGCELYDAATDTCVSASGSYTLPIAQPATLGGIKPDNTTITVNASTGVATATGVAANPASPSGSKQFNNAGSFGGNSYTLDATAFAGADMGAKITAAFAALPGGVGTVDASGFVCPGACHIGTANLTVPSYVTLILPSGTITRDTIVATGLSAQIYYSSYSTIIGQGKGVTTISGPNDVVGVQQAAVSGGVVYANIRDVSIVGTGSVISGSAALQVGGPNAGFPFQNPPSTARPMEIGAWTTGDTSGWPGQIAQYAVYDHTLTGTQIANHYTVGSSGTGYETTITGDTPILYYPMNEISGTTATDLIAGRNGTYSGTVTLGSLTGIPGDNSCSGVCTSPVFAGTSGILKAPSYAYYSGANYTVEMWLNTNTPDGPSKHFVDSGAENCFEFATSGGLGCFDYPVTQLVTQPQVGFTENIWYHVVITHDAAGILFYVNGTLVPVGSDVLDSVFTNIALSGADNGLLMNGQHGCICYNTISNVDTEGATNGTFLEDHSGYAFGVNSNNFYGGRQNGATGIHLTGDSKNTFFHPDIENSATHGIDFEGNSDSVISPYEEADGCDLFNGTENQITGPLGGNGSVFYPCGGTYGNHNFVWGPSGTPTSIGINGSSSYVAMNQASMADTSIGSAYVSSVPYPINLFSDGPAYGGGATLIYGRYGHTSAWQVGLSEPHSGTVSTGKTNFNQLADPATPTCTATGGTGTSYTYAVIGHDANGGITLPSSFCTVSGPATLDSTHYITISPPTEDGVLCWDALKADTAHAVIGVSVNGQTYGICGAYTAYPWIRDVGDATTAFTAPARNTTGDVGVAGRTSTAASTTTAAGLNIPHGTAPTTPVNGDCWTTTAGLFCQINGSTVGPYLASVGARSWSCQPGLGDGVNAIPAATYPQTTCKNDTGSTVTITGITCYADSGSSTMNVSAHTLGALLTGAVTCSTSWAAGTQSANVLLTAGDYLTFSLVADATTKQLTPAVKGTY